MQIWENTFVLMPKHEKCIKIYENDKLRIPQTRYPKCENRPIWKAEKAWCYLWNCYVCLISKWWYPAVMWQHNQLNFNSVQLDYVMRHLIYFEKKVLLCYSKKLRNTVSSGHLSGIYSSSKMWQKMGGELVVERNQLQTLVTHGKHQMN